MVMNVVRVVLAILYSLAFILSLSRCSPNASSIDKAVLRGLQHQTSVGSGGGGVIVDSSLEPNVPALKFHFIQSRELGKVMAILRDNSAKEGGNVLVRLAENEDEGVIGNLEEFRRSGEVEFSLEHSVRYYPAEAWIDMRFKDLIERATAEGCSLEVKSSQDGLWRVSLRDSAECKSRADILSHAEEILISFRTKDTYHMVDSVTSSDAP
jgi:hypothetical protein